MLSDVQFIHLKVPSFSSCFSVCVTKLENQSEGRCSSSAAVIYCHIKSAITLNNVS